MAFTVFLTFFAAGASFFKKFSTCLKCFFFDSGIYQELTFANMKVNSNDFHYCCRLTLLDCLICSFVC